MSLFRRSRARRPTARTGELLVEQLGDEWLVYDQRNNQVHCLSSAAGRVWRACDGTTSAEQLGRALNLESGLVERALGELDACGLLDGDTPDGVTRREATAGLAKLGAAAAAAPLIYSISAPPPALAATACGTGSLGCQGWFYTSANNVCPTSKCGAHSCACCFTTVKCVDPSGSTNHQGPWATCLGACASCTSYQSIANECAHYPSPTPINTSCAGHLDKYHCVAPPP